MKQTFGSILHDVRVSKNISPLDLSYMADVSPRAIYAWETGDKTPSLENVRKICKALNISIEINNNGEIRLLCALE